ncbi:uncharacterized protein LOC114365090 [Ostrinia furnacalis]|uniref:uncharacterized protein LOC114365090 n=1 Tax=Ostrinia furnacalis TaxID=93504 RepID=UPI00103DA070|nr:uncharacterized protein LOC114365090 [Ostrinia furnacalis]
MPCGKRPLIKNWDKPRNIRVITPSRYEQNEASVKQHWKKVIRDLELSYKDDAFWESQCDTVRELVGPVIFHRIAKIFNLPLEASKYDPQSDITSLVPSEQFYKAMSTSQIQTRQTYSMSDFEFSVEEEQDLQEEQSDQWSVSSVAESTELRKASRSKSAMKAAKSKSFSRMFSKSFSKFVMSKTLQNTHSSRLRASEASTMDESADTDDDIEVHARSRKVSRTIHRRVKNPHFDMLYCNESETDMIKWKSKYKQKAFEVSASDEFSKKAEIMTKKISKEFYDWWVGLGNVEFKSEIKRPEDIEDLFQVINFIEYFYQKTYTFANIVSAYRFGSMNMLLAVLC